MMKRIVFSVIAILTASVAVISCKDGDNLVNVQQEECTREQDVLASLNETQRNFYNMYAAFFCQFPDTMMVRWIKRSILMPMETFSTRRP